MLKNGRIAMVGLNTKNVGYVAEAIHDTVTKIKWFVLIIGKAIKFELNKYFSIM